MIFAEKSNSKVSTAQFEGKWHQPFFSSKGEEALPFFSKTAERPMLHRKCKDCDENHAPLGEDSKSKKVESSASQSKDGSGPCNIPESPKNLFEPSMVHNACMNAIGKDDWKPMAFEPAKHQSAPDDPVSVFENKGVNYNVDDWGKYKYGLIVVPGYTPPKSTTKPIQMHSNQAHRLERAKKLYDKGVAPFIFVSGSAVYPPCTPCFEGVEMKMKLIEMGVPSNRIIVDAAARHSTSNIRNAGRYMLQNAIPKEALVVNSNRDTDLLIFGQDFYFSHPERSGFHERSEKGDPSLGDPGLGYRVGELRNVGIGTSSYKPSTKVWKPSNDKDDN